MNKSNQIAPRLLLLVCLIKGCWKGQKYFRKIAKT